MKDGRLHVRVPMELLKRVQLIAKQRDVTLTFLVNQHFRQLVDEEERPKTDEELGVDQA